MLIVFFFSNLKPQFFLCLVGKIFSNTTHIVFEFSRFCGYWNSYSDINFQSFCSIKSYYIVVENVPWLRLLSCLQWTKFQSSWRQKCIFKQLQISQFFYFVVRLYSLQILIFEKTRWNISADVLGSITNQIIQLYQQLLMLGWIVCVLFSI